jgi:hypothetical protein
MLKYLVLGVLAARRPATGAAVLIARLAAYSESKLHVTALALTLARVRPEVLSNAVDPGWVPTKMGGPPAAPDHCNGYALCCIAVTAVRPGCTAWTPALSSAPSRGHPG